MSSDSDETVRGRMASPNALPDAYREQMWQTISRSWSEQAVRRDRVRAARQWGGAGLGLAAMLVLGVFIGRVSDVPGVVGEDYGATALIAERALIGSELSVPYRVAVSEHLREAETLLVLFGSSTDVDDELVRLAGDLAATTRLLMDSRAGEDAEVRGMLLNLELLLVQISRLVDARDTTEQQVVREGLEGSTVLPGLRQLRPERATAVGFEGVSL